MNLTCTAHSPPERFALVLIQHGRFDEPSFLAAHGQAGADGFAYAYAGALAREASALLSQAPAKTASRLGKEIHVENECSESQSQDFFGAQAEIARRFALGLSHLRLDTASFALDLLRARLCQTRPDWALGQRLARPAALALCEIFETEPGLAQGHKALCSLLLHSDAQNFVARAVARRSAVAGEQEAAARGAHAAVAEMFS